MNRFLSVFDPAKPASEVFGLPRTLGGLYGRTDGEEFWYNQKTDLSWLWISFGSWIWSDLARYSVSSFSPHSYGIWPMNWKAEVKWDESSRWLFCPVSMMQHAAWRTFVRQIPLYDQKFQNLTNCFCQIFVASPPAWVIISHSLLFFFFAFLKWQKN